MDIPLEIQQLNIPLPKSTDSIKKDIEHLRKARRDISRKINELEKKLQNSVVSETVIAHWEEFYRTQPNEKVQKAFENNCQRWEEERDCFNLNLLLAAHRVQISRKMRAAA